MFPGRERRQNRRTDRRTDRQERLVGGTKSRSPATTKGRSTAARETTATATVNDEGLSFDEQAEQVRILTTVFECVNKYPVKISSKSASFLLYYLSVL